MSNYPVGRRPRSVDPHSMLRLAALTAVVAGVVLLAAAAFVLSYPGIHAVALQAGVSPNLAKLYPVIFDAMLVVAGAAALALHGAGWWSRFYAWACLIVLLAAVAVGDAVHATGTALPERATRAALAVIPWVLLLLAFGLLLTMLRHFRKSRAAVVARQEARAAGTRPADAGSQPVQVNGGNGRPPVSWATAGTAAIAAGAAGTAPGVSGTAPVVGGSAPVVGGTAAGGMAPGVGGAAAGAAGTATATQTPPLTQPRFGLDFWLGPRQGQAPAIAPPYEADVADNGVADNGEDVSYGAETGYVHPDSYQGGYPPYGYSGGPGPHNGSGQPGLEEPAGYVGAPAQQGTAPDNGKSDGPADAADQADMPNSAAQEGTPEATAQAEAPGAAAPQGGPDATAQADMPDAAAQEGTPPATSQADKPDAAAPAGASAPADMADAAAQEGTPEVAAQAGNAAAPVDTADATEQADKADATAQADTAAAATQPEETAGSAQKGTPAGAAEASKPDGGPQTENLQAEKPDATEADKPEAAEADKAEAAAPAGEAKADGSSPAESAQDGAGETVAAQSPTLERVRSSPTPPEN